MSDYKTKQVFDSSLQQDLDAQSELNVGQQFEAQAKFVPTAPEPDPEPEAALEKVIRPTGTRRAVFGTMLTAFSGLVAWQAIDSVVTAISSQDWLSLGWAGFVAALSGLGIGAIGRELWKLRQLKQRFSTQEQAQQLYELDDLGKAKPFCQQLAAQSGIAPEHPGFERWSNAINSSHSDQEVMQMYDSFVVASQDEQCKKLIAKSASESALLVAISPLALVDMLLVAWRNFKLIEQLSSVYGIELGYWSRIKLFKLVLVNMAAAGASELVADASMDLLSMDLAGKVSTRAAQGLGVGILTARLGIKAAALMRPVPWQERKGIQLKEVRSAIIQTLRSNKQVD